jgi:hypothetical protein
VSEGGGAVVGGEEPGDQDRASRKKLSEKVNLEEAVRKAYLGEKNEAVDDSVGFGRIPTTWWTLNMRYNFDYELHRLNVGASMAREVVCKNDAASRHVRFDFVRDAPDLATYMHALRAELLMKMVMPTVVGSGVDAPFLAMARMETGPGGNPHWHGMAYGRKGPSMDGVVKGPRSTSSAEAKDGSAKEAVTPRAAEVVGNVQAAARAGRERECGGASGEEGDRSGSDVGEGGDGGGQRLSVSDPVRGGSGAVRTAPVLCAASAEPEAERDIPLEEKEQLFWEHFKGMVSEWNPCKGEDGRVRYRWDADVGAHDIEVDAAMTDDGATQAASASDGGVSETAGDAPQCGVCLSDFCPDVSATPHTVRLSSLLRRVLERPGGEPVAEVDLSPIRQLVAALVNKGCLHDQGHGMERPVLKKDPCARGKPECPHCRYGFPHKMRAREERVLLETGDREGQWHARFPRNDPLVGSYEPHVLLANIGNIDWRPMLNLWAVVEYVTKYAMKAPGNTKPMRDVLRDAVEEVCRYEKEGDAMHLMRMGLQKFFSKTLGGRDYGIFEAVHVGLGLPLVFPLLQVDVLNTQGSRVLKSGAYLANLRDGERVVWDSQLDKFDKRLELLRRGWQGRRHEDRRTMEERIRDVSFYEFHSKYYWRNGRILTRMSSAKALRVTPAFSADSAAVGHALHEAYARRCVVAYWRLMPTKDRYECVREARKYVAVDTRRFGGTLMLEPTTHAGSTPAFFDRYLGSQDLYDAFEGVQRRELIWDEGSGAWTERVLRRPVNCGWAFALMEMLVDPVLSEWVPKWIVEQYERRNPHFREALARVLREDRAHALTNRQLLFKVRRLMCRLAKESERAAKTAREEGGEGASGDGGSSSGLGSGSDDEDAAAAVPDDVRGDAAEEAEARRRMVQEPLPSADGFDGEAAGPDDDWAKRSAEQRASAAGPAPTLVSPPPPSLAPAIAIASNVSVNPPGYKWDEQNFVGLGAVKDLKAKYEAWRDESAGGEGEVLTRDALDSWQRFAYDIHDFKMGERDEKERAHVLYRYRALRMYLTGTAGTGKSRTIRDICG